MMVDISQLFVPL